MGRDFGRSILLSTGIPVSVLADEQTRRVPGVALPWIGERSWPSLKTPCWPLKD